MSQIPKQPNRIPFETLDGDKSVVTWALPNMENKGRVFRSARKEQKHKVENDSSIVIEDYTGKVKPKPLTVEQLTQMAKEAKQEGYQHGYEEGVTRGTNEGHAKGLKTGHDKAYLETKKGLNDEIMRLSKISAALMVPVQEQTTHLENIIVDIAMNFSKEIIAHEIHYSPQALYGVIKRALVALPAGAKNISVHLCESDATLVNDTVLKEHRNWDIKIDSMLSAGGCRVETLESLVDYTLESRLSNYLNRVRENGDIDEKSVSEVENFRTHGVPSEIDDSKKNLEENQTTAMENFNQADSS
ncbi:MAG: flagellar assembly protein FliH [Lentisphaeria bacterium]|jgi:flagellar assembly protein FliH